MALPLLALALPLLALALLAALGLFLWKVPELRVAAVPYSGPSAAHDRMYDENAMRATLAQIIGGGVLLIGLYFTYRNVRAIEEGKITDRFSTAVQQLGSEKLEIRLGGIYALERIARDSERDHWPVMEVLVAYIRENAPSRESTKQHPPYDERPPAQIQAILTVLGRRVRAHEQKGQYLNLNLTDLTHADLVYADLRGADLMAAELVRADLSGAHLDDADLDDADLRDADLMDTDLTGAQGLTWEQINAARNVDRAKLPDYLQKEQAGGNR